MLVLYWNVVIRRHDERGASKGTRSAPSLMWFAKHAYIAESGHPDAPGGTMSIQAVLSLYHPQVNWPSS